MIKTFNKMGIEGKSIIIIKTMYDNSSADNILNGKKLKAFSLK